MCMDVQVNEKEKKMSEKSVDEDVQIVEARVNRGKLLRLWVAAATADSRVSFSLPSPPTPPCSLFLARTHLLLSNRP